MFQNLILVSSSILVFLLLCGKQQNRLVSISDSLFKFNIKENKRSLYEPFLSSVQSHCTILCAVYRGSGRKHRAGCCPFTCSLKAKWTFLALQMQGNHPQQYPGTHHIPALLQLLQSGLTKLCLGPVSMGWGFVGGLGSFSSFCFPQPPIPSAAFQFLQMNLERFH